MVVAEWDGRTRAQTTQALKPTDVRLKSGSTIKKDFKDTYEGNREKGFKSVIPETKADKLQEVYSKINKERNKEGKYDELYRLKENSSKLTQAEITKIIEGSDISAESKKAYKEALVYKEGKRESVKETIKSQMTAPNGKPSNLNEVQHKLVRTPAFKKWFGDWENDAKNASKVVDENGEPLVVYHGTDRKFDVFDMSKLGSSTGNSVVDDFVKEAVV